MGNLHLYPRKGKPTRYTQSGAYLISPFYKFFSMVAMGFLYAMIRNKVSFW